MKHEKHMMHEKVRKHGHAAGEKHRGYDHEGRMKEMHAERKMHAKRREMELKDNRMVKDDHQEGIRRVIQRPGDMEVGQGGKMHNRGEADWGRSNERLTPRRG